MNDNTESNEGVQDKLIIMSYVMVTLRYTSFFSENM
jgi:hypothetical protein